MAFAGGKRFWFSRDSEAATLFTGAAIDEAQVLADAFKGGGEACSELSQMLRRAVADGTTPDWVSAVGSFTIGDWHFFSCSPGEFSVIGTHKNTRVLPADQVLLKIIAARGGKS